MRHTEVPSSRATAATRLPLRAFGTGALTVGLITLMAACGTDSLTSLLKSSGLHSAVTGPAADAVGPDGKILLAAPPHGADREVSSSEAIAYASAWTRNYAPMTREWLEKTHGAPITFKTLSTCGRALYARSAFGAPPKDMPAPYRRIHGPWWLVTMCDAAGVPTLSVAVSAWATELSIQNGMLRFPAISGNELVAVGVPVGHVGEYPSAPEAAIELAAHRTGKRVSEVPDLVTPSPADGPPQLARWRLTLDQAATVRTASGGRAASEVLVGPTSVGTKDVVAGIAAVAQPESVDLEWTELSAIGEKAAGPAVHPVRHIFKLPRRLDTPAKMEPISAPED